jgi:hypothetical protein
VLSCAAAPEGWGNASRVVTAIPNRSYQTPGLKPYCRNDAAKAWLVPRVVEPRVFDDGQQNVIRYRSNKRKQWPFEHSHLCAGLGRRRVDGNAWYLHPVCSCSIGEIAEDGIPFQNKLTFVASIPRPPYTRQHALRQTIKLWGGLDGLACFTAGTSLSARENFHHQPWPQW